MLIWKQREGFPRVFLFVRKFPIAKTDEELNGAPGDHAMPAADNPRLMTALHTIYK